MKRGKYSYQEVKDTFYQHGCELLSDSYCDNKDKLSYKCICGNLSKITFARFLRGGRCNKCGRKRAAETNKNKPRIKKEWKKTGLCGKCGNSMKIGSRNALHCPNCSKRALDLKHLLWSLRLEKGLCKYCNQSSLSSICETCFLKQRSKKHFGSTDKWIELKQIYDNQNNKCPYTGKYITLGINASLDHIVPKKLNGQTTVENLQWVYSGNDFDINVMKADFEHENFLNGIKNIYLHCFKKGKTYATT